MMSLVQPVIAFHNIDDYVPRFLYHLDMFRQATNTTLRLLPARPECFAIYHLLLAEDFRYTLTLTIPWPCKIVFKFGMHIL
jgi:hypothetical protein